MTDAETPKPATTTPESFVISVQAFDDPKRAKALGQRIGTIVRELSRDIDLHDLDGITVAANYGLALANLDRGIETSKPLAATDSYAVGVAMTPTVMRNGEVKSHIVINAHLVTALEDLEHADVPIAIHLIAHECAHVEVTSRFDDAFPNVMLQPLYGSYYDAFRSQVILSCWDEFAATWISAPYGFDPTLNYEATLLDALKDVRERGHAAIKLYRDHADLEQMWAEVSRGYGDLLKISAYVLGNMEGRNLELADRPDLAAALKDHWFLPRFEQLRERCRAVAKEYGAWKDRDAFEAIGDLADDLLADGGIVVVHQDDGGVYLHVPFTPETT